MSTEVKLKLKTGEFENIHGEKFRIHTNGIYVFMSGDEVDAMVDQKYKFEVNGEDVINLFNPAFSTWSKDELNKLGRTLMDLTK